MLQHSVQRCCTTREEDGSCQEWDASPSSTKVLVEAIKSTMNRDRFHTLAYKKIANRMHRRCEEGMPGLTCDLMDREGVRKGLHGTVPIAKAPA